MSEYIVIYEQAHDGGWGAYIPDLPGVVALGANRDEVAVGIEEALGAYAEDLRERGVACRRRITVLAPSRRSRSGRPATGRERLRRHAQR